VQQFYLVLVVLFFLSLGILEVTWLPDRRAGVLPAAEVIEEPSTGFDGMR
jgi:hypothetical protein